MVKYFVYLNLDENKIACLCNIEYVKIYDISSIKNKLLNEDDDKKDDDSDSSGWEVEEEIQLEGKKEEEKEEDEEGEDEDEDEEEGEEEECENEDDEEDEDLEGEEGLIKKEIDLNDNSQLEALLADGEFGDILKQIKNKKTENKEDGSEEKENSDKSEEVEESQDYESDSDQPRKKIKGKTDKMLKFKALGKKRNSEWIIEKEKRKHFFNEL